MASGRPILGQTVNERLRVWMWNLEDPRDELERRLCAICQRFGITSEDLGGQLFVDSGREQELCTATTQKGGAVLEESVIDRLIGELRSKRIDVLIVDPFISSHQVSGKRQPGDGYGGEGLGSCCRYGERGNRPCAPHPQAVHRRCDEC